MPILGGKICRWLLLFHEYDFEVVVKIRRLNVSLDHLSQLETGEDPSSIEDNWLDAQLFAIRVADDHFMDIIHYLTIGIVLAKYTTQQKKDLVVK